MRVVTKEEFFAALKADPRDIMPSVEDSPDYSEWKTRQGTTWGRSYPGWKNPQAPKQYMLAV